jgi:hypothetical protein
MDETLSTSDLAALLGITQRRAQQLVSALEGLGFALERDQYGGRRVPVGLATLLAQLRDSGKPLEALITMPEAVQYLRSHPAVSLGEAVGLTLHSVGLVRRALAVLDRSTPLPPWGGRSGWHEAGLEAPQDEG